MNRPAAKIPDKHDDRKSRAINAEAGGLHGGQLAGLLHQAEGDQHRQQDRHGGHQINQRGAEVQQIFGQQDERDLVADDVGQQFEEREHQGENQKRRQDHRQVHGEITQDHVVEDQRKLGAVTPPVAADCWRCSQRLSREPGRRSPIASSKALADAVPARLKKLRSRGMRSTRQSRNSPQRKKKMLPAHTPSQGDDLALTRQRHAHQGKEVIDEYQHDGQDKSSASAALVRGEPKRNSDQCQHQAGRGQREAAMELNFVIARLQEIVGRRDPGRFLRARRRRCVRGLALRSRP